MLTTVFKDPTPRGIGYALGSSFLGEAVPGLAEHAVALYFVHGSQWIRAKHNTSERLLQAPQLVLHAARTRPAFRNNNQRVADIADDCDWHFVIHGTSVAGREALRREFVSRAAHGLAVWLKQNRSTQRRAQVWWDSASCGLRLEFAGER